MLKVDNEQTIHINRGDRLVLEYSIDNDGSDYIFQKDDYIIFSIYEKKGLDKPPIIHEKITPIVGNTTVDIDISSDKMKIGEIVNKEKEYWYEIQLNNENTTNGFDEDGAKKIILYPEGVGINVKG